MESSYNLVCLAMVFLWWTRGDGFPYHLVMKSGGTISFDSTSEINFFFKFFSGFFCVLSVGRRLRGGGSWVNFRIVAQLW